MFNSILVYFVQPAEDTVNWAKNKELPITCTIFFQTSKLIDKNSDLTEKMYQVLCRIEAKK